MTDPGKDLKPITDGDRLVINLRDVEFEPYINDAGEADGLAFQHDRSKRLGSGFHLYKMEPGYTTVPHRHRGNEEFYIISGEAVDHDGTVYRAGDLVLLKDGTQHCTYTEKGCVILVYLEGEDVV